MSKLPILQTAKHKFCCWVLKPELSCWCQGLLHRAIIAHNIAGQRDHPAVRELDLWDSTETKIWAGAQCPIISCYSEDKDQNPCDLTLTATLKSLMKSSTLNTDVLNSSWGEKDQKDILPTLKFLCRKSNGISMAISWEAILQSCVLHKGSQQKEILPLVAFWGFPGWTWIIFLPPPSLLWFLPSLFAETE